MSTCRVASILLSWAVVASSVAGNAACALPPAPCDHVARGEPGDPLALEALACFSRSEEPVLRDPVADGSYEVASDGHAFLDETGTLRMIYTGDEEGRPAIKLATGTAYDQWEVTGSLLTQTTAEVARNKETAFYRLSASGQHQIYFIAYDDEETYEAQIFVAAADALSGPYTVDSTPLFGRGQQDGHDIYLMTSPSVVDYEGTLHIAYIGWNASPNEVSQVWVLGATSEDDGATWSAPREVDVPIGMEGQITVGPDGRYYAVSMREHQGSEAIFLAVAEHPFGPYTVLEDPVLVKGGAPYEVNEANAPMIVFDEPTRTAHLYYVGADYWRGWWMMLATAPY